MTEQDRLASIRQRRAAMPEDELTLAEDVGQEYYGDFWRIEDDGDLLALTFHRRRAIAEFIAHAPDDIDHLLGEVERLRAAHQAIWEAIPVVWDPADPHGLVFAKIATTLVAAKMPEAP